MSLLRNQLSKNAAFILTSLALILVIFFFSLDRLFDDVFLIEHTLRDRFFYFYLLFSSTILLLFLIFTIGSYRMIYSPLQLVLKRIQNLKNPSQDNDEEDYFETLPDFWNQIEEEVTSAVDFHRRKNKQNDRIKRTIENILNVFPEPTLVVSREGSIRYFNKAFTRAFPFHGNLATSHISDLFREPQVLSLIQEAEDSLDSRRKELEIQLHDKDAKKIFIVFKTPYATRNEDGEHDVLLIFHDITQIKKTDQMKTDFVSNVSHELRTPLMSIQGYMQTLKDDFQANKPEHIEKYFEVIDSHVERLSNLIGDLLELSYLESDITLQKKPLTPQGITQKIIKQFSLDLEKGQYKIDENYSTEELHAEERLVEQVLINLLQNSLRYTPHGSFINIQWQKQNGNTVLVFKDNGPGISEEHLNRIFERFYRIDPHRSRARGGTGLGLSIVKHILQRHGGSVQVESQLGYGVEFKCVFPDET